MEKTELWSTIVGSHMWRMETAESDLDLFVCEVVPTRQILLGQQAKSAQTQIKDMKVDMVTHEIGKVIYYLQRGNVHFVWGLTSPRVETTTPEHKRLRNLFETEISRNCFASINGLATHNIKDGINKYGATKIPQKNLKLIARTIQFGIYVLENGSISYNVDLPEQISIEYITKLQSELQDAYEKSDLCDAPDKKLYEDFLCEIRVKQLTGLL